MKWKVMIISIDVEKASDKTQYLFKTEILNKQGINTNFLNLKKCLWKIHN